MPNGWHYMQDGDTIRGDTYRDLLAKVINYRAERRIAIGNAQVDVDDFICKAYPHQCHTYTNAEVIASVQATTAKMGQKRMTDYINEWANSLSEKPLEYVYSGDSEQRAVVCVNCPYQKNWEHECAPCAKNTQTILSILRGGRDVPHYHTKLKGCASMKMCTRTAVWLKKEFLPDPANAPEGCWLKQ